MDELFDHVRNHPSGPLFNEMEYISMYKLCAIIFDMRRDLERARILYATFSPRFLRWKIRKKRARIHEFERGVARPTLRALRTVHSASQI